MYDITYVGFNELFIKRDIRGSHDLQFKLIIFVLLVRNRFHFRLLKKHYYKNNIGRSDYDMFLNLVE